MNIELCNGRISASKPDDLVKSEIRIGHPKSVFSALCFFERLAKILYSRQMLFASPDRRPPGCHSLHEVERFKMFLDSPFSLVS